MNPKKYKACLLSVFALLLLSCNKEAPQSNVNGYFYDEVPPINCQDISLFCAVWAERNGYEAYVYVGFIEVNGEMKPHAQAQMKDFDGKLWWLKFNYSQHPKWVESIEGWEPHGQMTTDQFLQNIHMWALQNNFYRKIKEE